MAKFPCLSSPLKPLEYKLAISRAEKSGMKNTFIQSLEKNESKYTPVFDGSVGGEIYG